MAARLKLLGKPGIFAEDGTPRHVRGHQAWALLARAVLTRQPLDRRTVAAELFSESADPLGSLRWCLASLRKALDCSECLVGDPIELSLPEGMEVDVSQLEEDVLAPEHMEPLLGDIEPQCGPEFSTWLLVERARIAALIDGRIRRETMRALAMQDYVQAARLASVAISRNAFDESAHILLIKGLTLAGRQDEAFRHIEETEQLFLDELGAAPSRALRSAARSSVVSAPAGVSTAAHVKSLLRAGTAALGAGAADAGVETLRQAVSEAEKSADQHLFASATLELGKGLIHAVRGFDDEGSILIRQCMEIARSHGYEKIAASGYTELGYVEALAGRRPVAAKYLQDGLAFARDDDDLATLHAVVAFNLVDWGNTESGLGHYAVSLDHARRAGNRRAEIWSLGLGARGQLAAGKLENAERWLTDCLDLVDEIHWVAFRPWPVSLLGETQLRKRSSATGIRVAMEEAFALSCQLRDPCWEAASARSLALTFAAKGEAATAAQWLDEAYRRCIRETDAYIALQVEILASKVEMSRALAHIEDANLLAREWIALAARAHMDAHVDRAARFLAKGSSDRSDVEH